MCARECARNHPEGGLIIFHYGLALAVSVKTNPTLSVVPCPDLHALQSCDVQLRFYFEPFESIDCVRDRVSSVSVSQLMRPNLSQE